jgi:transposase
LTIVLDLQSGAVVFVGDGKCGDALKPFWKSLRRCQAKIEAVAIDMSPAYIDAISTNLPNTTIVFDHFHVIKLFNDKLSQLRRDLHREATAKLQKNVLKGTRWLLLKNPENLDDRLDERQRLLDALSLNQSLATAYYLKKIYASSGTTLTNRSQLHFSNAGSAALHPPKSRCSNSYPRPSPRTGRGYWRTTIFLSPPAL